MPPDSGYTRRMRTAFIIPTLGGPSLSSCLDAVEDQELAPDEIIVVSSASEEGPELPEGIRLLHSKKRLGFASAVNRGIEALGEEIEAVALLNDDAFPESDWLEALVRVLDQEKECATVQGIVLRGQDEKIDGSGLGLDAFGLPVQLDRGEDFREPVSGLRRIPGVSATAALYRREALDEVRLNDGVLLDQSFDSYHEDVDLALRLARLGWTALLQPGAICRHRGSYTGKRLRWRHPWWVLSNRWRVLASNFRASALLRAAPRLLRGELRAIRSLGRENALAFFVAPVVAICLPWILLRSFLRPSPGVRLRRLEDFRP